MYRQIVSYFSKHAYYNSFVHVLVGIGLGILLTYPLIGEHPLRWGVGFLAAGFLGHLLPLTMKK